METMTKEKTRVSIRWMMRIDRPSVLAIENANYAFPWSEEEFLRVLRQRNCIGMVAEYGEKVVGFMVYELHRNKIYVSDFAVDPAFCRRGIGSQMIAKLVGKLSSQRRDKIKFMVRESNLAGCKFLKSQGFTATVSRGHFDDSGEDGYQFTYALQEESVLAPFLRSAPRFTI